MTKLAEAIRRRTDAQAALTEIEVMFRNGELILIDDAIEEFGQQCSNVRAKFLNIPTKAAPQMLHADRETRRKLVRSLVEEALDELD